VITIFTLEHKLAKDNSAKMSLLSIINRSNTHTHTNTILFKSLLSLNSLISILTEAHYL